MSNIKYLTKKKKYVILCALIGYNPLDGYNFLTIIF
jgi:hypothetical protein